MRQIHFAAAARAPATYADWQDREILSAMINGDIPQAKTQDNLLNPAVSRDVRHIVELHDKGEFKAFESIGQSHVVLMDLIKFMKNAAVGQHMGGGRVDGLLPEVVAQAVKFVKSIPAENIFIRFEVADKKPSLPEYNPAHICAYDADRAYGSDYLQIARRLTITGTTTSVMNDVDLGTLLESGKKKCAVLYMGTRKDDELTTLGLSSQLALDTVVAGIEGGQSVEVIDEQVQILLEHPEIAELYSEVAELRNTLTDFKNTLQPDLGKNIVERLEILSEKLALIGEIDNPLLVEMMAPVASFVEIASVEPMIIEMQEIMSPPIIEGSLEPPVMEWEQVKEAVALVMADDSLPRESKALEIRALIEQSVPSLLQEAEPIKILGIMQDLQSLDMTLKESGIPSTVPLLQAIAENHPIPLIEPQKLSLLADELSRPENMDILKAALGDTPQLDSLVNALSLLRQEIGGVDNGQDRQAVLQKLEAAMLLPSPETAPFVAALAVLQTEAISLSVSENLSSDLRSLVAEYCPPAQVLGLLKEQIEQPSPSQTHMTVSMFEPQPLLMEPQNVIPIEQSHSQRDVMTVIVGLADRNISDGQIERIADSLTRTPEVLEVLPISEAQKAVALVLPELASRLIENKSLPPQIRESLTVALKSDDPQKLVETLKRVAPLTAEIIRKAEVRQPQGEVKAVTALLGAVEKVVATSIPQPPPPKGDAAPVTPQPKPHDLPMRNPVYIPELKQPTPDKPEGDKSHVLPLPENPDRPSWAFVPLSLSDFPPLPYGRPVVPEEPVLRPTDLPIEPIAPVGPEVCPGGLLCKCFNKVKEERITILTNKKENEPTTFLSPEDDPEGGEGGPTTSEKVKDVSWFSPASGVSDEVFNDFEMGFDTAEDISNSFGPVPGVK